jgi:uncharacterized protein
VRSGRAPVAIAVAVVAWLGAWVAAQALITLVLAVSGESFDDFPTSIRTLAVALVASWVAYMTMLWVVSQRVGSGDFRADYAVDVDVRDLLAVPIGVLTQLVVVPVVYVPLRGAWPGTFTDDRLEERTRDLVDVAGDSSVLLLVVLVVVGAPVVEELVYRGLIQRSLAARISEPLALVGASAWFAVIHFQLLEMPGLFVAGLVFGACLLITGRLATAIVAHAAFNATALLAVWPT